MDGISNTVHPRPPWPSRPRPPPHAGAPPRAVGTRLLPSPSSRFPPPPQPATPPARISKQETNGAQARPPFSSAARRLASPDGTPGGEAAAAAARNHARHVRARRARRAARLSVAPARAAAAKTATRQAARTSTSPSSLPAAGPSSPQASRRLRPERIARAPERSPGSSTAVGRLADEPERRRAAPRSRARLTSTTEPLTKVHTRSGTLVLDLTDGRAPGVDGV